MSKSGKIFWIAIAAMAAIIIFGTVRHRAATNVLANAAPTRNAVLTPKAGAAQASSDANEARFQLAIGGALMLRRTMRDPDSFVVSSALVTMKDQSVCYKFRARNGFGGMDASAAVLSPTGFVMSGQSGFYEAFLRNCAGESGYQLADHIMAGLREYDRRRAY